MAALPAGGFWAPIWIPGPADIWSTRFSCSSIALLESAIK